MAEVKAILSPVQIHLAQFCTPFENVISRIGLLQSLYCWESKPVHATLLCFFLEHSPENQPPKQSLSLMHVARSDMGLRTALPSHISEGEKGCNRKGAPRAGGGAGESFA